MAIEEQKRVAAVSAAELVAEGMVIGLGSGTTMEIVIQALGERVAGGLRFQGVPTSEKSASLARALGIELVTLEERAALDLAIDGADEVDPHFNLIKGHRGALLREKIVAEAARSFIAVIDASKQVERLGTRFPVPIEVVPFGWTTTRQRLQALDVRAELRGGARPYTTDGGNFILDAWSSDGWTASQADAIKQQTGVIEHGLFFGNVQTLVIGKDDGQVQTIQIPRTPAT